MTRYPSLVQSRCGSKANAMIGTRPPIAATASHAENIRSEPASPARSRSCPRRLASGLPTRPGRRETGFAGAPCNHQSEIEIDEGPATALAHRDRNDPADQYAGPDQFRPRAAPRQPDQPVVVEAVKACE